MGECIILSVDHVGRDPELSNMLIAMFFCIDIGLNIAFLSILTLQLLSETPWSTRFWNALNIDIDIERNIETKHNIHIEIRKDFELRIDIDLTQNCSGISPCTCYQRNHGATSFDVVLNFDIDIGLKRIQ